MYTIYVVSNSCLPFKTLPAFQNSILLLDRLMTLSVGGASLLFFIFLLGVVTGVVGAGSRITMFGTPVERGLMLSVYTGVCAVGIVSSLLSKSAVPAPTASPGRVDGLFILSQSLDGPQPGDKGTVIGLVELGGPLRSSIVLIYFLRNLREIRLRAQHVRRVLVLVILAALCIVPSSSNLDNTFAPMIALLEGPL